MDSKILNLNNDPGDLISLLGKFSASFSYVAHAQLFSLLEHEDRRYDGGTI